MSLLEPVGGPLAAVKTTPQGHRVLVAHLWELADDFGRLRRSGAPSWMIERAEAHIEICLNVLHPSAGELFAFGIAVEDALEIVEERGRLLRRSLGEDARP